MPNIKSAKKKVRKDIKRTKSNNIYREAIKKAMKLISKLKGGSKSEQDAKKTVSLIDKAVKRKIMHKNKAARLKSRVMKLSSRKK
jgi:small subunit ribosomal protein S20